jgi:hypothetical protein
MNRIIPLLGALLIWLSNCPNVAGQGCATTLQKHFSVYHSDAVSGSEVSTTVTIQGYASITPSPGCNMNAATHKVGAYNLISGTGGWNYSASGCPNCYFSVTNTQGINGIPDTTYPFDWEGEAICSMVGVFFGNQGSGGVVDCGPGTSIPLYKVTCPVSGTTDTIQCAFGGPNTCCSIPAHASTAQSGASCNPNTCLGWAADGKNYQLCCFSSVAQDGNCNIQGAWYVITSSGE